MRLSLYPADMSVAIFAAIILAFSLGREWIVAAQTGWRHLSKLYRCKTPFTGKYRGCWWAQFTVSGGGSTIVVDVGHMSRWPIRLDIPSYWIGASREGLYLARNVWNLLHPAFLIPWQNIRSANEIAYKDVVRKVGPASYLVGQPMAFHPVAAAAQGIAEPLLELKLSEPNWCISLTAQLAAFQEAVPFLGTKLALLKSQ